MKPSDLGASDNCDFRSASSSSVVAHVITTDVRDEAQCKALIDESIAWLARQGKAIDVLALGPIRSQTAAISPERSTEVWRNVMETNYFGPALCLKYAVPHFELIGGEGGGSAPRSRWQLERTTWTGCPTQLSVEGRQRRM